MLNCTKWSDIMASSNCRNSLLKKIFSSVLSAHLLQGLNLLHLDIFHLLLSLQRILAKGKVLINLGWTVHMRSLHGSFTIWNSRKKKHSPWPLHHLSQPSQWPAQPSTEKHNIIFVESYINLYCWAPWLLSFRPPLPMPLPVPNSQAGPHFQWCRCSCAALLDP